MYKISKSVKRDAISLAKIKNPRRRLVNIVTKRAIISDHDLPIVVFDMLCKTKSFSKILILTD